MKDYHSMHDLYFMINFNSYNSLYEISNLFKRRPGSIGIVC